jgi:hypothetical protein
MNVRSAMLLLMLVLLRNRESEDGGIICRQQATNVLQRQK